MVQIKGRVDDERKPARHFLLCTRDLAKRGVCRRKRAGGRPVCQKPDGHRGSQDKILRRSTSHHIRGSCLRNALRPRFGSAEAEPPTEVGVAGFESPSYCPARTTSEPCP